METHFFCLCEGKKKISEKQVELTNLFQQSVIRVCHISITYVIKS